MAREEGPVLERDQNVVGGQSVSRDDELLYAPGRTLRFRFEEAKAAQQADIAITIKLQVTVDVGEAELFPLE